MYNSISLPISAIHWILQKEPEPQNIPVVSVQDLLMRPEYLNDSANGKEWLRQQLVLTQPTIQQVLLDILHSIALLSSFNFKKQCIIMCIT